MHDKLHQDLKMTVYSALLAALIAAGAYVAIPVGPVPIVLQNMFVLLAGLLLGKNWGACSVAVYLIAGSAGLPVFAQGRGGMGVIFGPTGGYLLSYLLAVYITGMVSQMGHRKSRRNPSYVLYDAIALVCGTIVVYIGGVPWLKMYAGVSWSGAMALGLFPFLLGDGIKIIAAIVIARTVRPIIRLNMARSGNESAAH